MHWTHYGPGKIYVLREQDGELWRLTYSEGHPEKHVKKVRSSAPFEMDVRYLLYHPTPEDLLERLKQQLASFQVRGQWFRCSEAMMREVLTLDSDAELQDASNKVAPGWHQSGGVENLFDEEGQHTGWVRPIGASEGGAWFEANLRRGMVRVAVDTGSETVRRPISEEALEQALNHLSTQP